MSNTVYLNGQFIAASAAKISVFDRGFLFADSVYEVIPFYQGMGFQLDEHLARLNKSLAALHINADHSFGEIATELVAKNGGGNKSVYIQVTRGAGTKRSHLIDNKMVPTVFACTTDITDNYALDIKDVLPIKVIVCEDLRGKHCDIKSTSLLANILVMEQARENGAQEALLERDGLVLEGASSSLFIVEDELIIAPQPSNTLLSGTTSQLVKRLALNNKLHFSHQPITYARLLNASEVWISSSTRGLLPVVQIDDTAISKGQIGPMWQRLYLLLSQSQSQL
ncbi:MAG: aminotransferase class IV [Oceanospirillaceae bacterium]|nr:aminotransferase class IV [Oceanospirillaceae bacterium]